MSGGLSLDNEDYDGEIYTLFTTETDTDLRIRNKLFTAIIYHLKYIDCKSVHVEITTNDLNKDFYIDNGAEFITAIENMKNPPYTTLDFGWTDIYISPKMKCVEQLSENEVQIESVVQNVLRPEKYV